MHPDLDRRVPLDPSNHCHLIHPKKTFIYVSLRRLHSIIDLNKNLLYRKTIISSSSRAQKDIITEKDINTYKHGLLKTVTDK